MATRTSSGLEDVFSHTIAGGYICLAIITTFRSNSVAWVPRATLANSLSMASSFLSSPGKDGNIGWKGSDKHVDTARQPIRVLKVLTVSKTVVERVSFAYIISFLI